MTFMGEGVPKNISKGINMLEKAIAGGNVNAMTWLGGMFYGKFTEEKNWNPNKFNK